MVTASVASAMPPVPPKASRRMAVVRNWPVMSLARRKPSPSVAPAARRCRHTSPDRRGWRTANPGAGGYRGPTERKARGSRREPAGPRGAGGGQLRPRPAGAALEDPQEQPEDERADRQLRQHEHHGERRMAL